MALTKTENNENRSKRTEKMKASERITNCFMLNLTYGLCAILLLEVVRKHYEMIKYDFASILCISFGILFAAGVVVFAVLGGFGKIKISRMRNYIIFFVASSLISFYLSYDVRVLLGNILRDAGLEDGSAFNFLINLDLAKEAHFAVYGVIAFLVIAFIVYALRLAFLEKKHK